MKAGIYIYPWDLADEGLDTVLNWARDSGLAYLHPSSNYHAGWFLHPHNPRRKAFFAPDGALFFHPTPQFWEDCSYRPPVAPVCAETDWLKRLGERVADFDLQLTTWTICGHNTPFGLAHPEAAVHNAWGDPYPHAPCPAHPLARAFHCALVADLSHSFPLEGIQIESCGYLGWKHGHHHERDNTGLNEAETQLINLCFNPATIAAMRARDFDPAPLQVETRHLLETAFNHAPNRPAGHPLTKADLMDALPDLKRYLEVQRAIEAALIAEMRAAMQPDVALYQMGAATPELEGVVQGFNINAQTPRETPFVRFKGFSLTAAQFPQLEMLREQVEAAKNSGADRIVFWNYSEAPRRLLDELQSALDGQIETGGKI